MEQDYFVHDDLLCKFFLDSTADAGVRGLLIIPSTFVPMLLSIYHESELAGCLGTGKLVGVLRTRFYQEKDEPSDLKAETLIKHFYPKLLFRTGGVREIIRDSQELEEADFPDESFLPLPRNVAQEEEEEEKEECEELPRATKNRFDSDPFYEIITEVQDIVRLPEEGLRV